MTRSSRRLRGSFLPLLLLLVSACVTESHETAKDSFMGRMKDRPSENTSAAEGTTARTPRRQETSEERPAPRPPPAPKLAGFPDTRVMLYQPKGDLLMLLVNESHSGRNTEAGRIALALGES